MHTYILCIHTYIGLSDVECWPLTAAYVSFRLIHSPKRNYYTRAGLPSDIVRSYTGKVAKRERSNFFWAHTAARRARYRSSCDKSMNTRRAVRQHWKSRDPVTFMSMHLFSGGSQNDEISILLRFKLTFDASIVSCKDQVAISQTGASSRVFGRNAQGLIRREFAVRSRWTSEYPETDGNREQKTRTKNAIIEKLKSWSET